jgi:hypothetical protein
MSLHVLLFRDHQPVQSLDSPERLNVVRLEPQYKLVVGSPSCHAQAFQHVYDHTA